MASSSRDVEKLRLDFESNTEWGLRRQVLLAFKDKIPLDRLVCLSHCFINHEIYGNTYPFKVMKKLEKMRDSISDCPELEAQASRKKSSAITVKFVKEQNSGASSDTQESKSITQTEYNNPAKPCSSRDDNGTKNTKQKIYSMKFEKAATEYKSTELSTSPVSHLKRGADTDLETTGKSSEKKPCFEKDDEHDYEVVDNSMTQKMKELSSFLKSIASKNIHVVQRLTDAATKCGLQTKFDIESVKSGFCCEFYLDDVEVAVGNGSKKKDAKNDAFEKAQIMLNFPHLQVVQLNSNGKKELHVSSEPFTGVQSVEVKEQPYTSVQSPVTFNPKLNKNMLKKFIILQTRHNEDLEAGSEASILAHSADFSKIPVSYVFLPNLGGCICKLSLGSQLFLQSEDLTRQSAKSSACSEALKFLRQICWTVRVKQNVDTDADQLEKDEILGAISKKSEDSVISDNNIGSKLLKKMGWTGGGVGKEGNKGIAEPIKVQQVINRSGLGLDAETGIPKQFLPCIKETLKNYLVSDNQEDISFSSTFSKEERALIHKEAQKLGLRSQSYGKGEDRFLTVRRKRTAGQLIEHLVDIGGSSHKYDLIAPGSF